VTDFYGPMLMALVSEAAEPTALALLRVDQQPVVVCLTPVMAVVNILLGDINKGPAHRGHHAGRCGSGHAAPMRQSECR
jgi:hypothetical protein